MRRAHSGFGDRPFHNDALPRREFLKSSLLGLGAMTAPALLGGCDGPSSNLGNIGELGPAVNGVRVPEGFSVRIVAREGQTPAPRSLYLWHGAPDGGATYATPGGGWIYVSNAERLLIGGASALRFDPGGAVIDAYPILGGTNINCAGGKTPWNTWLSCEEIDLGLVYECDVFGKELAVQRPALGRFKHEAAAYDTVRHHVYLTEDESDGCLYRFVPERLTSGGYADLSRGRLEVAVRAVPEQADVLAWVAVPDPSGFLVRTRQQVSNAERFRGGEGIWYHDDTIYFATKGDNVVRAYDVVTSKLREVYRAPASDAVLRGVDNVTVTPAGDVLVAEDGDDMQIVAVLPDGSLKPLVQLVDQPGSEITGPALSPSGDRLYFSSQRAPGGGITYELRGRFLI